MAHLSPLRKGHQKEVSYIATTRPIPLHTGKGRTVGQAIRDIIDYTENPQKTDGDSPLCPCCHGKTRMWIREDTVLHNFLLFCPKCKQEELIDLQQFHITLLKTPDAKTQS